MEDLIHDQNYSQYLMKNPKEIISTLSKLSDHHALVNAFTHNGLSIVTTILDITNTHLYIDVSQESNLNTIVLRDQSLLCMTFDDKIKIEFEIDSIVNTTYDGKPAFKCAIPDILLRLQRREFYRVHTPILHPILARYSYQVGMLSKKTEIKVIDISGGGMAAVGLPDDQELGKGNIIKNCEIVLPHIGSIHADFEIRYITQMETRSGHFINKAGVRFINIQERDIMMIQKYVMYVERERKSKDI